MVWPVKATAINRASVGTRVWISGRQMCVTAVVKATFALCEDAPMKLLAPDPLKEDEEPEARGRGLKTGGDMAPALGETDFWMVGHARGTLGSTEKLLMVQVGVVRDGGLIYEKRLPVVRALWDEEARGYMLGGWGPLSKHWPVRAKKLGGKDVRVLEGGYEVLGEGFDMDYFQSSPKDQRWPRLVGDEWLMMKNVFGEEVLVRTQLPGARGEAKVYGAGGALSQGRAIRMELDMVQVDVDRRVVNLVWRGCFPVAGREILAGLEVRGGAVMPGEVVDWERVVLDGGEKGKRGEEVFGSTMYLGEEEAREIAGRAATPFEGVRVQEVERKEEQGLFAGTMMVPEDVLERLSRREVMPFAEVGGEIGRGIGDGSMEGLPFARAARRVEVVREVVREDVRVEERWSEDVAVPSVPAMAMMQAAEEGRSLGDVFLEMMRNAGWVGVLEAPVES